MKIDARRIKRLFRYRKHGEKGQTFAVVLVLLLVVSAIIVSSLTYVGATIVTNKTYINNTKSLYAAEAGIQDGIWNTLNQTTDDLSLMLNPVINDPWGILPPNPNPTSFADYDYNPYGWKYQLPNPATGSTTPTYTINTYPVNVTVKNTWVPLIDANNPTWTPSVTYPLPTGGINPPSLTDVNNIINDKNLTVSGVVVTPGLYKVVIYYKDTSPTSTPLIMTSIGCWLPQGFTYNNGKSDLQGMCTSGICTEQAPIPCAGNQAVVWTFSPGIAFTDLADRLGYHGKDTLSFTFQYTTSNSSKPYPDALAWITDTPNMGIGLDTNGGFAYPYSWNDEVKVYDLISDAGNTEIEAYIPKSRTRALGSALAGDYVATGNSLLKVDTHNSYNVLHDIKTIPVSPSSATVSTVPDTADLQGAYLYWTGWIDGTTTSMPLGNSYGGLINFKINGKQVYFNGSGDPAPGAYAVGSSMSQTQSVSIGGYAYSCYRDVTDLVRYELQNENPTATKLPGNATYDISPGAGCTLGSTTNYTGGQEAANAGWSIILIYWGPTTLGHQLYLYDTFSAAWGNQGNNYNGSDIDVTGNTSGPGGVISGFLVPPQLPSEINDPNSIAAKITAFVAEGDYCYSGDFIALNAPQQYWSDPWSIPDPDATHPWKLWDGVTLAAPGSGINYAGEPHLPNNASHPDNVWNSANQDTGATDFGIDIKTFNIKWSSGLIHPGDTSARIDVPTQIDGFNVVYIIFSFRSSFVSGGSISYLIRKPPPPP